MIRARPLRAREKLLSKLPGEDARRLKTIPGIGTVTAAAITALAPPAQTFARGRDFAAWLGLTPLQRPPAASRSLPGPQKGASAQYAAY
jgi:transposase